MISLKRIVRDALDTAFVIASDIVRELTLTKQESEPYTGFMFPDSVQVTVRALVLNYRSGDIDGTVVKVGDEKVLIRSRELAGIINPSAGDVIEETHGAILRDVIAARQDATESFWTLQTRRAAGEDWGDLTAFRSAEDWGDLSPFDTSVDFQN